jgi:superoxide dismutase, Fe-Mn family
MFELPQLGFEKDALAPWTSAQTFDYHHGKHHAGYVTKLNTALEGHELSGSSLSDVIATSRGSSPAIFHSAAQHFNHSFFWNCLSASLTAPQGKVAEMIDRDFGSFESFKELFSALAGKHFGSGWAWLLSDNGTLVLRDFHDADTPADSSTIPLLTLDVWEHAYYIDHRNNRAGFIEGFWAHVNWEFVGLQLG